MQTNERIEKLIILYAVKPFIAEMPEFITPFEVLEMLINHSEVHPNELAYEFLTPLKIFLRSEYLILTNFQLYARVRAAIFDINQLIESL